MTCVTSQNLRRSSLSLTAFATGLALLAACKPPAKPCEVTGFSVTPPSASVVVGAQTTLTANTSTQDCSTAPTVSWTSLSPGVATVNGSGQVTGVSAGSASIRANVLSMTASSTVTVTQAAVASVQIDPSPATVKLFGTATLSAVARDAQNTVLSGRTTNWQSMTPAIVSVNSGGVLTGLAVGQGTVTATIDGVTAIAVVAVGPAAVATVVVTLDSDPIRTGQNAMASSVLRDVQNNVLTGRTVTYGSTNPSVASVHPTTGAISGIAAGTAQITATSEGIVGTRTLTVVPAIASVTVTVPPGMVIPGSVVNATVVLRDAQGNVLIGRTVLWSTAHPGIATVSPAGVITAVGVGFTTVTAISEGQQGSIQFTVQPPPIATVTVSLGGSMFLGVGQTRTASFTARDAQGNVLTGRAVAWTSSNHAVATIHPMSGLMTGVGAGVTSITATVEGIVTVRDLTVTPAVVSTVTVTLSAPAIQVGQTSQATFVARDALGTVLTGRTATWSVADPAVATINQATGLLTAVGPGVTALGALVDGVSGGADLTVTAVPVASVTVVLQSSTLFVGTTTQAVATTRDAQSNLLTGRSIVWSSASPAVATVNPSTGLVTAVGPGVAAITATSEGIAGQSGVTVTIAPVASVEVSLLSSTLNRGLTTVASVIARDALGNVLPGRTATWSASNFIVAAPPPSDPWTFCAIEGSPCVFQGSKQVRYGENGRYLYRQFVGSPSYFCGGGFTDPLQGVAKKCWVAAPPTTLTSGSPTPVTAIKAGTASIVADVEGVQGTALLTVPNSVPMAWAYVSEAGAILSATSLANAAISSVRTSIGAYTVTFSGMGPGTLGSAFAPFVTATSWAPVMSLASPRTYCSAQSFAVGSASVTTTVQCRNVASGAAQDVNFNISVIGDDAFSRGAGFQELLGFSYHGIVAGAPYAPAVERSWNAENNGMSVDMSAGNGVTTFNLGMTTNGATGVYTTTVSASPGDQCNVSAYNGNGVVTTQCIEKVIGPRNAFHGVIAFENGRGNAFYAFIQIINDAIVANTSRNTGGGLIYTKMATGRYYVTFTGKSVASYPAVFLTPFQNALWRRCVHWLQNTNPVTFEVACYDENGNFADTNFNLGFQN